MQKEVDHRDQAAVALVVVQVVVVQVVAVRAEVPVVAALVVVPVREAGEVLQLIIQVQQ